MLNLVGTVLLVAGSWTWLFSRWNELEPDKISIKTTAKVKGLYKNFHHDVGNVTLRPTHCLKVVVLAEGKWPFDEAEHKRSHECGIGKPPFLVGIRVALIRCVYAEAPSPLDKVKCV